MAKWQKPIYFSEDSPIFDNLEKIKKVYKIKTKTKLLEYIIENELEKSQTSSNLKELHEIYNTKNDWELIQHLIKLEFKRQGI